MASTRTTSRRRQPRQARSQGTVDAILEAAARVFRRDGWRATTNRIASEAGVGVGSLYEYFPNKQALLVALAERHLQLAEAAIAAALEATRAPRALLAALQAAVLESQRFPSQALELVTGESKHEFAARAARLRANALAAIARQLMRTGHDAPSAELRARAVFGAIGELSVQAALRDPASAEQLCAELLEMAARHCEAPAGTR